MKSGDCPNCGEHLGWDPETLEWDCRSCGRSFSEEEMQKVSEEQADQEGGRG